MPKYSLEIGTVKGIPAKVSSVVKEDDKEICAYRLIWAPFQVVARLPNGDKIVIIKKGIFKTIFFVSVGSNVGNYKDFHYTSKFLHSGLYGPKGEKVLEEDEITLEGGERVDLFWRGGHPIIYEWTLNKPEHKGLVIALAIIAYHLKTSVPPGLPF